MMSFGSIIIRSWNGKYTQPATFINFKICCNNNLSEVFGCNQLQVKPYNCSENLEIKIILD